MKPSPDTRWTLDGDRLLIRRVGRHHAHVSEYKGRRLIAWTYTTLSKAEAMAAAFAGRVDWQPPEPKRGTKT